MDFKEVLFRLKLHVKKKVWKLRKPTFEPQIQYEQIDPDRNPLVRTSSNSAFPISTTSKVLQEADRYLMHKWGFFGLDLIESEINWHVDPQSGIRSPTRFGFDINHRDEQLVGNIKNTWEKNRHHHLTILALAFFLTKNEKYAKEVETQLESWIEQNPYLIGVNWTHPLEQGVRLISWVYIFFLLEESTSFDQIFGIDGFIWNSVYEHQRFIHDTYSQGSSANNHVIGEMAGLFISSFYWPIFSESKKWNTLSKKILEKELFRQTYLDGVNRELAFSYQIFVLEFGILSLCTCPEGFSDKFRSTLRKMYDVVFELSSIIGYAPNYGDGDEGMALQLQSLDGDRIDWLLSLSNKILQTSYPVKESLPQHLFDCPENSNDLKSKDFFFSKEAGICAGKWNVKDSLFSTLIDIGPLGMGTLAAHGHADALSFTLTVDNIPIIVDPGTYCYHDNLEWRSYFRSVKAHNTISVDNMDQSHQLGPFLWGKRADCKLLRYDEKKLSFLEAEHDGFKDEGVIHKRGFNFDFEGLMVTDLLDGEGKHGIEMRFHFHPNISIKIEKYSAILQDQGIVIEFDSRLDIEVLSGQENGGWYSPNFGSKMPTNTLVLSQVLSLPAKITTRIKKV